MVRKTFASFAVSMSLLSMGYALPYDPVALLAAEADSSAAEGESIVHEEDGDGTVENIASRYMLAQLSIVQGLTERLSSDLVAAVPDEVAESLQEVLADARALEAMAIDVGAGEYDELLDEMEADPAVQALYDKLDTVIAELEDKAYYNSSSLAEVVSLILNIISDL